MKKLILVESPAKAKTIEKYLGKDFTVKSSKGHIRNLPKSQFGINIENDFEPKYIIIRDKRATITELKKEANKVDKIYIATDPDREGEAIAWHIAEMLGIDSYELCRIVFNEITKTCVTEAINNPRNIDLNLVEAQQTRRILDRIVGYKLSPLLWKKVQKGLSAGRVQSVVVSCICDRENEIKAFIPKEYWTIDVLLEVDKNKKFTVTLIKLNGKKFDIINKKQNDLIISDLKKSTYIVNFLNHKRRKRNSLPPFITSSMQQECSHRLGFSPKKTMHLAQQLYEGLEIKGIGHTGLITYMRTDSFRLSQQSIELARKIIIDTFGSQYLPIKPNVYKKKAAQDAHEAIRPVDARILPEQLKDNVDSNLWKVYKLVWERFIASQISPVVYDVTTCEIQAGKYLLKASGSRVKFAGFTIVYDDKEKKKTKIIPPINIGEKLGLVEIQSKQKFTEPPARYNEASLIKYLEEMGIGRPSTYVPIIETITNRGYVEKIDKNFFLTKLGYIVNDLLKQYFASIVDIKFTASMEGKLDEIAAGEKKRVEVLRKFFDSFKGDLERAEITLQKQKFPEKISEELCDNCNKNLVYKKGRFGEFLACPAYPECKFSKKIKKITEFICQSCNKGFLTEKKSKKGSKFFGCSTYPKCMFASWDIPFEEKCPKCDKYLFKKIFKGHFLGKYCFFCGYGKKDKNTKKVEIIVNKQ